MSLTTTTKLLQRECQEQLDGTEIVLSYFAPTTETLQELVNDLFQHHWQHIVVGPCIQGAVFEVRFEKAPRLSHLDGYVTVDLGHWHFHLCIGPHQGTQSEELRHKRPVAQIAFFEERGGWCAGGHAWGIRLWNGFGEQMITVFLPNPFLTDAQKVLPKPQWERLQLWYSLREKYLGEPLPTVWKPVDASGDNPFLHVHGD